MVDWVQKHEFLVGAWFIVYHSLINNFLPYILDRFDNKPILNSVLEVI